MVPPDGASGAAIGINASPAVGKTAACSGEPLTFRFGGEEYGIVTLRVQEIRSSEPPTRIAIAPSFIQGAVNLRRVIIPVVGLRLKLGGDSAGYDDLTVLIVLYLRGRLVGAVVDAVSDVLELTVEHIKPAPALARGLDAGFITGIGSVPQGAAAGEDGAPEAGC